MLTLRLPDGSAKQVAPGSTPRQVAEGIGKRLAQAAIAAKVDGQIVDLDRPITPLPPVERGDGANGEHTFQVLTEKDPDSLEVLRHSCAHVMARAVMRLFPGTQLAFGPPVEDGFYYDIDVTPPIREEDFPKIEEEMRKIVKEAEPFERFERPTAEARGLVADLGQTYKVEHIDDDLKQYPSLSFYRQGEFIDLCRGPHIPHAGKIGAFKLMSIAGAYWKNDASRKQLQRLKATAFFSQKELDEYLKKLEEGKKRDHRVLGKQLGLFTISPDLVGPGLILWMPKGATVRGILETFIKDELIKRGYQPVYTPHIGRLELYRMSGHFPYYRDSQYPPFYLNPIANLIETWWIQLLDGSLSAAQEKINLQMARERGVPFAADYERIANDPALPAHKPKDEIDKKLKAPFLENWLRSQEGYLLKPMNCPHHIQIYKAQPRSYRDLPVRLAEFGTVYRFEQTGELNGMTRVRGFTQDDAHLFITPEQIEGEVGANLDLVLFILSTLDLHDYRVRVGLRDPNSDKYVGEPADWEKAENALIDVVRSRGMNHTVEKGEAAFYGPKIDFVVNDCIGREWQLGTVQLDYNLPKRFDLHYIDRDNTAKPPVMIHRAPFGSMERFVGILIEHFAGAFPLWLAPEQVRILTVSEKFNGYASNVEKALRFSNLRVTGDYGGEKIGAKIRTAQLEKIPYMLVVGEKEQAANTVAVRHRTAGDQGAVPVTELIARLESEVNQKK